MKFLNTVNLSSIVLSALVLGWVAPAVAQLDSQPTQSSASRVLDMPLPTDLTKDSRAFAPARIFGNTSAGRVGLDLREKPAGGAPQLKFSTMVETKVDNKTTNSVEGGGGGGGGPPPPPPFINREAPNLTVGLEFSDWVRQSLGAALPVFGADLMGENSSATAIDPLTVPADYRVGPGDEILIRAWGQIDIDFQGQIDRTGQIFLPKIGPIMVAGMPVRELNEHLKTQIQKQYKNFELSVTLGQLRQIQFYAMGFVKRPGVYVTSSTASALYGLMSSGGVQAYGDLRNIELRRGGVTVAQVDAYRFLIDGERSNDPQLLPGDVLYVPPAKGFAGIAGSVKRPAIFHLDARTTLDDLLKASGGFTLTRNQIPIRVERFQGAQRSVEHTRYSPELGRRKVMDGELFIVLPASPKIDNVVTLRGHVAQPLRQGWTEGMRVSDLFSGREDLLRMATWVQRNEREAFVKLGDPRRDTDFKREFPDLEWDYAAIERIDPVNLIASVKTFSLRKALENDAEENVLLQPSDVVVIFAQSDFKQPQSKRFKMVRIEGEVKVPGIYPFSDGEELKQVLAKAGGLTDKAYVFGTVFTRQSAKRQEEERLRQAADRVEQDYLRYLASRARYAVSQEEAMIGTTEFDAVRALVGRLRAVAALGRIPLNLRGYAADVQTFPKLILEDEDTIYVPNYPATVTVVGAVFQEGSQLWVEGWNVSSYLDGSGGLRNHADSSTMAVIRADGTVRQVGGWWGGSTAINPGDTIVVPEDVRSTGWTKVFRDWSQIFYQMGLGAAAIHVLTRTP